MKLYPRCISCLIERAGDQVELATDDEGLRFEAIAEFVRFMAENVAEDVVPPVLGSERNRIIVRVTSNPNPCAEQKRMSVEAAEKIYPHVEALVREGKDAAERIRRALVVSAIGNSMEFGVAEHEFDPSTFAREFDELFSQGLGHDDSDEVVPRLLNAKEILLLTDNSGEMVLDRVLLEQIKEAGPKLFVAAKSSPVQDDVTIDDVRALGVDKVAELLPAGDFVGVFPDRAPAELREKLKSADLVLAKGMGNYETLSEYEDELRGRLVYLLRVKCGPVASSLGAGKGTLVAKFVA